MVRLQKSNLEVFLWVLLSRVAPFYSISSSRLVVIDHLQRQKLPQGNYGSPKVIIHILGNSLLKFVHVIIMVK